MFMPLSENFKSAALYGRIWAICIHIIFHSHIQIEPTSDTEYLSDEMSGIYLYTYFVTTAFD